MLSLLNNTGITRIDFLYIRCIYFKSLEGIHYDQIKIWNWSHLTLNADREDATHTQPRSLPLFFFLFHFLSRFIARMYSLKHLRVIHIRTYACILRHRPVVTRFPSRQFALDVWSLCFLFCSDIFSVFLHFVFSISSFDF